MQELMYRIIDNLKNNQINEEEIQHLMNHLHEVTSDEALEVLFVVGDTLVNYGLFNEAEQIFTHLYFISDYDDHLLAYLADIYITDDKIDKALSLVNEAPKTPTSLMVKAEIFQQLNLPDVSLKLLLEAKEIQYDYILDFGIAELNYQEGNIDDAILYYEKVREYESTVNGINIDLRLGELYALKYDFQKAKHYFESVDKTDYTNEYLFKAALMYDQLEAHSKAKELLVEVIQNEPYFINAYIQLMNIYEDENSIEEAIEILKTYIAHDDTNPTIYFHIGRLSIKLNRIEDALQSLKICVTIDPEYDDAYLYIFQTLLNENLTEDLKKYTQNLNDHALSSESMYFLAKLLKENEAYEQSISYFEQAEADLIDSIDFNADYYELLNELRMDSRKNVLYRLLKIDSDNIEWQYELERLDDETEF